MKENETQAGLAPQATHIEWMVPVEDKTTGIIKVIGVGGGGGNAVENMYHQGVCNVTYAICNTDSQALAGSDIPVKIQLGSKGLGVGGDVVKGGESAEESREDIRKLFNDHTEMVFITAGMGGGTGTGAAPVIAAQARELGLLTVGVVTLPFVFEKRRRIEKALLGVEELNRNVDALLVISNERLLEVYADEGIPISSAFAKADEILTVATKSIAEIITQKGIVNRDFCDVQTVMKNGGRSIMSIGYGTGEHRLLKALQEALDSPLLNDVELERAQRLLYIVYTCKDKPVLTSEISELNDFMETLSPDLEVLWGLYQEDTMGEAVKVTIIATGFDKNELSNKQKDKEERQDRIEQLHRYYYGYTKKGKGGNTDCFPPAQTDEAEEAEVVTDEAEENAPAPGKTTEENGGGEAGNSSADGGKRKNTRWMDRLQQYFERLPDLLNE